MLSHAYSLVKRFPFRIITCVLTSGWFGNVCSYSFSSSASLPCHSSGISWSSARGIVSQPALPIPNQSHRASYPGVPTTCCTATPGAPGCSMFFFRIGQFGLSPARVSLLVLPHHSRLSFFQLDSRPFFPPCRVSRSLQYCPHDAPQFSFALGWCGRTIRLERTAAPRLS